MSDKKFFTAEEEKILQITADLYNEFCKLPEYHPMEKAEFCDSIHKIQRLLALRGAQRERNDLFYTPKP